MKSAGHVARMGQMRNICSSLSGTPERRDHFEDLYLNGEIILERMLWKYGGKLWIGCICLRIGTSGVLLYTP
jgi:hypothetical protein